MDLAGRHQRSTLSGYLRGRAGAPTNLALATKQGEVKACPAGPISRFSSHCHLEAHGSSNEAAIGGLVYGTHAFANCAVLESWTSRPQLEIELGRADGHDPQVAIDSHHIAFT